MANKAKFDRSDVVQKATDLYWEKGFNGTSMRNLQDAIDLRPGSIYAAFGSKEGLFKESLTHYADLGKSQLDQCQQEANSIMAGLALFTHRLVVDSHKDAPSGMCMLQKSVGELTDEQPELLAYAQQLLQSMEQEFVHLLTLAKKAGELPDNSNPEQLGRYLQVQIFGLRNYGRANRNLLSKANLQQMVNDVFTQAPFA